MACHEDGRDCEEYVGLHVGVIETRILLVGWMSKLCNTGHRSLYIMSGRCDHCRHDPSAHELMSNEQLSHDDSDASANVSTEVAVLQLMDKYKFHLSTLKDRLTGTTI